VEASARPGWTLRQLPARAVAAVLVVEMVTVGLVVAAAAATPALPEILLAASVAGLSVVHTELATGIERIRRRTAETSYFDLSSVWTFAAALLLPPALAAAVVVVVYTHLWQRVWRPAQVPLYRHVYTTATVVLAATAAHLAVLQAGGLPSGPDDVPGVVGVAFAVVAYVGVNSVLVALAIRLSGAGTTVREVFGRLDDNALEVATLCMGALAAVALAAAPGLVAMALPPILVLHRAVLVRQLEEVAFTDAKTGLLTVAAWRTRAGQVVRRVQQDGSGAALLILDLDLFKAVNDAHGHLAGDDVLAAVAAELRAGVRERDLVGRFGGEEFVVLMPELRTGPGARRELLAVAERLRERVTRLAVPVDTADGLLTITGLSVSVGGACIPADGTDLDQVLKAADTALYAAKRGGRNTVRIAGPAEIPAPRAAAAVPAPARPAAVSRALP
jgi:diguanylate cyclase (GGDEF)-like protein